MLGVLATVLLMAMLKIAVVLYDRWRRSRD